MNHQDYPDADHPRVSTSPCPEPTGWMTEAQLDGLRVQRVEARIQRTREMIAQADAHQLLREIGVAHFGSSYSASETGCHAVDPVLPESVQPTVAPYCRQRWIRERLCIEPLQFCGRFMLSWAERLQAYR